MLFSVYVTLALLVTHFLQYPTEFVGHDEFVHEAIALQIDQTGHLFHPLNSILPEASYYPGMEIVTTALQHATGLSLHAAGCIVLALAFTISTLALIQIMRRITGSVTAACLAALIYLCNQETLYFNTGFSYASLAMPMAFFCIYVFSIRSKSRKIYGLIPVLAVFVSLAATHHLTSLAVVLVLWGWNRLTQLTGRREPQLYVFYLLCLLVVALWTWFAGAYVISYIRESLASSVVSVEKLINGGGGRKLFATPAGYKTPQWEAIVSFGSVLLILIVLIPAAWYVINRWRLIGAAGIILTALALTYPAVPFGHLTNSSSEAADRSAPFIFCGVAYVVAIWWFRRLSIQHNDALLTSSLGSQRLLTLAPVRRLLAFVRRLLAFVRRPLALVRGRPTPALVLGLTFCFVGGGIIGASDWSYTPGKYIVSSDERSIDQLALAAGSWEAANIKPSSRFVGDRDNSLVAQLYGGLHAVTPAADKVDEGSISNLLLRHPAPSDIDTVCADRIRYLIADVRLSTALPELGVYVDGGEYLSGTRIAPPSVADLTKFNLVPGAERIYDNGAIRVYDLEGLSCPG